LCRSSEKISVDVPPGGDHVLDRAESGLRRGDLHVEVRLVDPFVQALRLRGRGVAVVREIRIDLPRDVAVLSVALVPDRPEIVERVADVGRRELKEDLLRIGLAAVEDLLQLLVVALAVRDRLLEDRRVRRHADHGVLVHHPGQLSGLEHVAGEVVDPDALAERGQFVEIRIRHW